MARIRTIKPEFFTSEDIAYMTPLARLFYVSLWCEADREGRLSWKPKTLKMRYLPAEDCDIDILSQELIDNHLIEIYEIDGKQYAHIPSFTRHQIINNRESDSVLPPPPARVNHASTRVTAEGRKEGKGKERKEGKDASKEKSFDAFWSAYPRKISKAEALKAFEKLSPDDQLLSDILESLERQKKTEQWQKDGGQFVPHASTWLNQRRWEDEISPSSKQEPSGHAGNVIYADPRHHPDWRPKELKL